MWKWGDNPSLIWGQMGLELGRAPIGLLGWRRGPQDRVETRRNHPYFKWLVYIADFPWQAWNSKTIFWASCPYSSRTVKELRLIPSPVALQPAPLHPFWWQTKWSFQKAKLTQSSFHWKLCYFFPLVLKLEIYFFFLFTASKASCDLGFTGSLTPPYLCAVFSQPGCFLLCYLWGVPLPEPFAPYVCYAGSTAFFQTCHGFSLTLTCVITIWCLCLSLCCEMWVPVLLIIVTPGPDMWLGLSEGMREWMNASQKRRLLTWIRMDEQNFIIGLERRVSQKEWSGTRARGNWCII